MHSKLNSESRRNMWKIHKIIQDADESIIIINNRYVVWLKTSHYNTATRTILNFPHFSRIHCLDIVSIPFFFPRSLSCLHIITLKYDFHFKFKNLTCLHANTHVVCVRCISCKCNKNNNKINFVAFCICVLSAVAVFSVMTVTNNYYICRRCHCWSASKIQIWIFPFYCQKLSKFQIIIHSSIRKVSETVSV